MGEIGIDECGGSRLRARHERAVEVVRRLESVLLALDWDPLLSGEGAPGASQSSSLTSETMMIAAD